METVADSIRQKLYQEKDSIDYVTRRQLFFQVIQEIDWSVGEILDVLKREGIDQNTLVIFATDNGPSVGSAFPLRGKKGSTYEGGMRVPAIARWPGKIPGGKVCNELVTSMDLFPTFAYLAETELPGNTIIDGKNIWTLLSGVHGAVSPHDRFFYHAGNKLKAVRAGNWKLHRTDDKGYELYDLEKDISEQNNVAMQFPGIVDQLAGMMTEFDREMTDSTKTRPHGTVSPE